MTTHEKMQALRQLKLGDKVRCTNGNVYEFVRLKQKKFIGKIGGQAYDIPVEMFVELHEKNEKPAFDIGNLRQGDLFYILSQKQEPILFRFKYMIGPTRIMSENPVTKTGVRIPLEMVQGTVKELMQTTRN